MSPIVPPEELPRDRWAWARRLAELIPGAALGAILTALHPPLWVWIGTMVGAATVLTIIDRRRRGTAG